MPKNPFHFSLSKWFGSCFNVECDTSDCGGPHPFPIWFSQCQWRRSIEHHQMRKEEVGGRRRCRKIEKKGERKKEWKEREKQTDKRWVKNPPLWYLKKNQRKRKTKKRKKKKKERKLTLKLNEKKRLGEIEKKEKMKRNEGEREMKWIDKNRCFFWCSFMATLLLEYFFPPLPLLLVWFSFVWTRLYSFHLATWPPRPQIPRCQTRAPHQLGHDPIDPLFKDWPGKIESDRTRLPMNNKLGETQRAMHINIIKQKEKKEMKTLGPVSKQHSPFNIGSLVMPSSIQSLFKSQLISRNGARRWGQAMAGRGTKCAGILERH